MKFLNKVKGTLDSATRKSQDVLEVNKINNQIKKREGELANLFQQLGEKVFSDPAISKPETRTDIDSKIKNIQYLQIQLNNMKNKVLYLKDLVACDVCDKVVPLSTKFCPDCGRNIAELVKGISVTIAVEQHKDK